MLERRPWTGFWDIQAEWTDTVYVKPVVRTTRAKKMTQLLKCFASMRTWGQSPEPTLKVQEWWYMQWGGPWGQPAWPNNTTFSIKQTRQTAPEERDCRLTFGLQVHIHTHKVTYTPKQKFQVNFSYHCDKFCRNSHFCVLVGTMKALGDTSPTGVALMLWSGPRICPEIYQRPRK